MRRLHETPTVISPAVLLLAGCTPWPPYEAELRQHFEEHRDAFTKYSEAFKNSDHRSISRTGFLLAEEGRWTPILKVEAEALRSLRSEFPNGEEILINRELDDEAFWEAGFTRLGIHSASKTQAGHTVFGFLSETADERTTHISFHDDPTTRSGLITCREGFQSLACGRCKVDLSDVWYIFYGWIPGDLLSRYGPGYEPAMLEDDELYLTTYTASLDRCLAEGDEAMGYETAPFEAPEDF